MNRNLFYCLFALFLGGSGLNLSAQGTAFLYQGRLNDGGSPATGNYDFVFSLYDAPTNGNLVTIFSQTNLFVAVNDGLFTTNIDFGPIFTGTNYWLAIATRSSGTTNVSTNAFTFLWPRQPLLPAPYAIFANSASNLTGTLPTTQLAGTLTATQLAGAYSSSISFTNAGNVFSGTFAGNGTNLVNLNGTQITGGTVADARLSTNVALLNGNQTFGNSNIFTGANTFTNRQNNFTGSFFGNGLVGWNNITGTAVQAISDHGYLLLNSGLTTVTLPSTASLLTNDIVRISGAGAGGWLVAENSGQSILGNFASYQNSLLLPASAGDWRCVASSANGLVMYAGGNFSGGVDISTDGGKTWGSTGITGTGWSAIACSADGTTVFAATSGGSIQYSTNRAATWTSITNNGSVAWSAIACSADGTKMVAAIKNGRIYGWSGGTPATFPGITVTKAWTSLAMSSDTSHIVAVCNGGLYASADGGNTWNTITLPAGNPIVALSANGVKLAIAIAGNGITTSTNFGASWNTNSAPTGNWTCLAGSSDCTKLVAGISNSVLYASANFGTTWSALNTTHQSWSGAALSADGSKLAVTVSTIGSTTGNIYYSATTSQSGVISTNNTISGSQGSAVELQYIGGGQFMPVSSTGLIWAN